jgi:adenylate cyclase
MELLIEPSSPARPARVPLEPGRTYLIGRSPQADICVPFDRFISRRHAEVRREGVGLLVRALPGAANPLFHDGRETGHCTIRPGEHFILGETNFILLAESASSTPAHAGRNIEEHAFPRAVLAEVRYRDPDRRIEVLSHLPDVIWGARNDAELLLRLVNLLLAGVPRADAAGVVSVDGSGALEVLQWDRRQETAGAFRPSRRLVNEAMLVRRQSLLHVWEGEAGPGDFTATHEFDWALCTPVPGPPDEHWAFYLGGRVQPPQADPANAVACPPAQLSAEVKFTDLVAEVVGAVRRLRRVEQQQAGLRQFLPPAVLAALAEHSDPALLAPRETEVTVMFCDLRGFSRQAETSRADLRELLDRVSRALGVMTRAIAAHGGVIGDFQGDSAMGFWGWPVASHDDPLRACRAALAIRGAFERAARESGDPLAGFRVGLGLAQGRAVAGRIGTEEHFVLTAFGPVVNLANRLEGMTRHLRVPIVIDDVLARTARQRLPETDGRVRALAKVLPYGMETPVLVSELVPSAAEFPELTAEHLAAYDQAVAHFIEGRWEEAFARLRRMPASDQAQDFLSLQIAHHGRVPPADWAGVVKIPSK